MIDVGILGTGNISETHARAAAAIPGVRIAAVYGRDRARAAALAARLAPDAPAAHDDLAAFLAHRPMQLVLVGSPASLHAEHGMAAARAGLHVLVEKPLDIATARARQLVDAAGDAGVRLGVFFQERASPAVQWLKQRIDAGELGRPILASARVRWYRPPEYYGPPRFRGTRALEGGGAVMSQAIHTLDLLLWLLGDVRQVSAAMATALHDIEVEDTAIACLEHDGGALATFEATTAAWPGSPRALEITGSEGTVVLQGDRIADVNLRRPPSVAPPTGEDTRAISASSPLIADPSGHRAVIEDFLRAIESGRRPLCDGEEGLRSVALVEAIYRASRTGAPVTPEV